MVIFQGPVFNGDTSHTQLAWLNASVSQKQELAPSPAFEELARVVAAMLHQLPNAGLASDTHQDVETAAQEVLTETGATQPDRRRVQRAVTLLKGVLAPIAAGLVAGSSDGLRDWASTVIRELGGHL